ncbi:MAG: polymerase subunit beta [Sporolactobacillus laevolacticus]|jgi:DNA polymerase-3 subunit beta|uniref:Beta sliding clamp n=2 Tax=Sporolactobacillus laevolacticus TaxID=33018 RepID=V6J114_9BACL|nr:DNA polymerase III subunit beta [Sporolactobacillus laevolacticus DSM 442]MDF2909323.1 polymerase subunit beta [Sporolactobacillus laevolacticus]
MQEMQDTNPNAALAMECKVQKEKLADAVNRVMKAISSKTTIPILTGVKITAGLDGITLTGSNSDISIKSFIPLEEDGNENAMIGKSGQIVLPSRLFSELVRKLPDEEVHIEVDSRMIAKITSGTTEFSLNGLDPEEYPNLPIINENDVFRIRKDLLKDLIKQTVYAVSITETRPVLTGVKWIIQGETLSCVATDSHRLAQRSVTVEKAEDSGVHTLVIPGASLNELSKILDDDDEQMVDIVMTTNQILFKSQNVQFYSRLLDGNYPDTSRLIPSDSKTTIDLGTKALYHAIERASLLAKEERNNVVKLRAEGNQVEISSQSLELGRAYETLVTENFEGEPLRISFSAKFMMDALSRLDAQSVRIHFVGPMRPIIIRPIGDEHILMLILPIRTF